MFARSGDDFSCHLDTLRVNDREPLPTLNPCADCVSYSPVLHQIKFAPNCNPHKAQLGGRSPLFDEERAANIAKLPELGQTEPRPNSYVCFRG